MNRLVEAGRRAGAGPLVVIALTAALLIGACGSGAERHAQGGAPAPAGSREDAAAPAPAVAHVEARQRAGFALLRTQPEGLPAATRRTLGRPVPGIAPRLAQRLPLTLSGAYWLVPAAGHLCVAEQAAGTRGVGAICARTADALKHGVASVSIGAPAGSAAAAGASRLIVGVAPDGARRVRVHTKGSSATVPVFDHVFVLRDDVAAPPDLLTPLP